MFEVIGGAIAGGYAVGQGAEQLALNHIHHNREAALPAYDGSVVERNPLRFFSRVAAPLAIVGALAAGAYAEAADQTGTITKTYSHGSVLVVADLSYATKLDGSHQGINTAIKDLKSNHINVSGVAAYDSTAQSMGYKQLLRVQPYGTPTMYSALTLALNEINNSSSTSKFDGIVVLDDGNDLGNPNAIMSQDTSKAPIDIVNFESNSPNSNEFQQISAKTHSTPPVQAFLKGVNLAANLKSIESKMVPLPVKSVSKGDAMPWLIGGSALSLLGLRQFFRRRGETAI